MVTGSGIWRPHFIQWGEVIGVKKRNTINFVVEEVVLLQPWAHRNVGLISIASFWIVGPGCPCMLTIVLYLVEMRSKYTNCWKRRSRWLISCLFNASIQSFWALATTLGALRREPLHVSVVSVVNWLSAILASIRRTACLWCWCSNLFRMDRRYPVFPSTSSQSKFPSALEADRLHILSNL